MEIMKKIIILSLFVMTVLTGCEITYDKDAYGNSSVDGAKGVSVETLFSQAMSSAEETVNEIVGTISSEDVSNIADSAMEDSSIGILTATSDIALTDVDDNGTNYSFVYGEETFSALYTTDNWKVIDSYKIDNYKDIVIICQALIDVYPIHGADMKSYRTAEDMAFEWQQHNIAYMLLDDDSPWKSHAKNVDLDPKDQGRTFYEIYEDRTGKEFNIEGFLK